MTIEMITQLEKFIFEIKNEITLLPDNKYVSFY